MDAIVITACKLGPVCTKVASFTENWPLSSSGFPECFWKCSFPYWSLKAQHKGSKNEGLCLGRKGKNFTLVKKVENVIKEILHLRTINGRGKSMIIVTFAQKRKKGQNMISLHLETEGPGHLGPSTPQRRVYNLLPQSEWMWDFKDWSN